MANDGTKSSHYITLEQAMSLTSAAITSYTIGQPFNRLVTLRLERTANPHSSLSEFLKLFRDWLYRHHGSAPHWIYVLENRGKYGLKGVHAHILMHVPFDLFQQFEDRNLGWLLKSGIPRYQGVVSSKQLRFGKPNDPAPKYLIHGLLGILLYLLEGIEPASAHLFGVRPKPQGVIVGKRCGYSQALSPTLHRPPTPDEQYRADLLQRVWTLHSPLLAHLATGQPFKSNPAQQALHRYSYLKRNKAIGTSCLSAPLRHDQPRSCQVKS